MDSKLKKVTVAICVVAVLLLVTGIVIVNYINGNFLTKGKDKTHGVNNQTDIVNDVNQEGLRDFITDTTFFDEEETEPDVLYSQDNIRVTLSCNSIYKDIRIQIIDTKKERVTGVAFTITIDGLGSYTDEDKDGVIYIDEVDNGDYEVLLNEQEGYRVPVASMKVSVSDVVSFSYITDIDILIHTADEINEMSEDPASHNADADETENYDYIPAEDGVTYGIDVSSWNGDIDWTAVQKAGVKFAMIRCGYRGITTGQLIEDSCFRQNIEDALAVGITVGVYFTSQAMTELEAVEEASMVIKLCREYAVTYPVFMEQESSFGSDNRQARADSMDVSMRTATCSAFCETMEHAGYRAGIMASESWLSGEIKMSALSKFYVYLAEYRETPTYTGEYVFWRYTENSWVDGITGRTSAVAGYYQ